MSAPILERLAKRYVAAENLRQTRTLADIQAADARMEGIERAARRNGIAMSTIRNEVDRISPVSV